MLFSLRHSLNSTFGKNSTGVSVKVDLDAMCRHHEVHIIEGPLSRKLRVPCIIMSVATASQRLFTGDFIALGRAEARGQCSGSLE